MSAKDVPLKTIAGWISQSKKIVGFTGAGISTNSGIPDFRSPNGVWAKNRTVMFQEFVNNFEDRVEYWRQKFEIWPDMRDAVPNSGHCFLAKLQEQGRLLGLITQNIDGLHEKSGIPREMIVPLHGSQHIVSCLACGKETSMDEACERVKQGDSAPECLDCGGLLKPATISFGQSLRTDDLTRATNLSTKCDLFLAMGSSLVVQPAAGFPALAKEKGARLVIINNAATPLDRLADAVIRDDIGETVAPLQAILADC